MSNQSQLNKPHVFSLKSISLIFLSLFLVLTIFSINLVSATGTSPPHDPSEVLRYNFSATDYNETHIFDSSGNANDGLLNNTQFDAGTGILNDGSMYFNGSSKISLNFNMSKYNFQNNFSISFFLYPNSTDNTYYRSIIKPDKAGSSGSFVCYYKNNVFQCDFKNNTGQTSSLDEGFIYPFNWTNFVITGDSLTLKLYVNGRLAQTNNITGIYMNYSNIFNFGGYGTVNEFNGSMDEIIMLNRTLSSSQINLIYNNYLDKECTSNPHDECHFSQSTTLNGSTFNFNYPVYVDVDNIIIDCNGSKLIGNYTNSGIKHWAVYKNNITIKNCILDKHYRNIEVGGYFNNFINNTFLTNSNQGLFIYNNFNSTIYNNNFINSNFSLYILQSDYNNISNNNFYNCTSYSCVFAKNSKGNIFDSNNMSYFTKGFHIQNETNDIYQNNILDNALTNFDGWNIGFYSDPRGSNNITIFNNHIDNVACAGIVLMKDSYWNVSNNWIRYVGWNYTNALLKGADCYRNYPFGIGNILLYHTYIDDGLTGDNFNYGNLSRTMPINSSNIIYQNNTILNFSVMYVNQGGEIISNDLTYNYYFAYTFPDFLLPKTELFLSSFNISSLTTDQLTHIPYIDYLLGDGYYGTRTSLFKIQEDYLYFQNIGDTNYSGLQVFNQSNALISKSDGSASICNGDCNITLNPNEYAYVYDNYTISTIDWIQEISAVTLNGGTTKTVDILFNVTGNDLNDSTASINLTNGLESVLSDSCTNISNQFNCSITFDFYRSPGIWNINISINNIYNYPSINDTANLTVNDLDYVTQDTNLINWNNLSPGSSDNEAVSPMFIINGGNKDYSNLSIMAYNITGKNKGQIIYAENFSISNITGQTSGQTYLKESSYVDIPQLKGLNNHGQSVNQSIYFYVDLNNGLQADTYSGGSLWEIKISS